MKKIIGILGVVVLAVTMFMNTNLRTSNSVMDLSSIATINMASAEGDDGKGIFQLKTCYWGGLVVGYTNGCNPGTANCNENDCSRFQQ